MSLRPWYALAVAGLLLTQPLFAQTQGAVKLSVPIPNGTTVSPIKYGDSETPVDLKPAEQVAFLFVSAIWGQEQKALEKDTGLGHLVTLGELIRGVKMPGGTIGLTVTPAKDVNYSYDVILVGGDCLIRAIPRVAGLGALAMIGSVKGFGSSFYYNPKGRDLAGALKITEMGFSGDGFSR